MGNDTNVRAQRVLRSRDPRQVDLLGPARRRDVAGFAVPLLLAAGLGLALGRWPVWTLLLLAAAPVVALALRVDLASLAVVALAPLITALADPAPYVGGVAAALLVVAWILARARGRLARRVPARAATRTALVLVALLVVLLARPLGELTGDTLEDLLRRVLPLLVALVLLDVLAATGRARLVAAVHVASALVTASVVLVVLVGSDGGGDLTAVLLHLLSALPLLVALAGRRHPVLTGIGLLLSLSTLVLAVSVGAASPAVLIGLLAMLLVAGATGQLGVRAALGVVAAALVTVGLVPQVAERLALTERFSLSTTRWAPDVTGSPVLDVVLVAVLVATGLLAVLPPRRWERDPLAGALATALVGVGATVAIAGGLEALPLWLLVALAASTRGRPT